LLLNIFLINLIRSRKSWSGEAKPHADNHWVGSSAASQLICLCLPCIRLIICHAIFRQACALVIQTYIPVSLFLGVTFQQPLIIRPLCLSLHVSSEKHRFSSVDRHAISGNTRVAQDFFFFCGNRKWWKGRMEGCTVLSGSSVWLSGETWLQMTSWNRFL
jgi:hypothetical protein